MDPKLAFSALMILVGVAVGMRMPAPGGAAGRGK